MKFLAFDTSTEQLHLGACDDARQACHVRPGSAQASAQVIPLGLSTLADLGLALSQLDAIVMGRGPGSFTGLRTACAVAQGLAFGAALPVLPIDTLLAVAEDARQGAADARVLAVLDARMDQYYAAAYHYQNGAWHTLQAPALLDPPQLTPPQAWLDGAQPFLIAGTGTAALGELGLSHLVGGTLMPAAPTAQALLNLAPRAWQAGMAVTAEAAMPLYLRDKVAQTTAERAAAKLT
jgi:tRNA threonylcarbamoyladenosine biosynthesis protein TsaB